MEGRGTARLPLSLFSPESMSVQSLSSVSPQESVEAEAGDRRGERTAVSPRAPRGVTRSGVVQKVWTPWWGWGAGGGAGGRSGATEQAGWRLRREDWAGRGAVAKGTRRRTSCL